MPDSNPAPAQSNVTTSNPDPAPIPAPDSNPVLAPNPAAEPVPELPAVPAEAVEGPWNGRWLPLAGAWGLKDLLKGIVDGLRADPNGEPFLEPVDHVSLGLTDYLEYVLLHHPEAVRMQHAKSH